MSDTSSSVLRARGLRKQSGKGEGLVRAVDKVDLDVGSGETVAHRDPRLTVTHARPGATPGREPGHSQTPPSRVIKGTANGACE